MHKQLLKRQYNEKISSASIPVNWDILASAPVQNEPYPHLMINNFLPGQVSPLLQQHYPNIKQSGFFALDTLQIDPVFQQFLDELAGDCLSAIIGQKLGLQLTDKPVLITIRKWSAAKDGRIHNDSESKIATALLYLNPVWAANGAGCLRVLNSQDNFNDMHMEIPPLFSNFFAFRRTDNSWHGHMPFVGERRVIQITWLQSWEDYHRKQQRGKRSLRLKNFFMPFGKR